MGWFLDVVQECVNYEMKLQKALEDLARCTEANKKLTVRIKELQKDGDPPPDN